MQTSISQHLPEVVPPEAVVQRVRAEVAHLDLADHVHIEIDWERTVLRLYFLRSPGIAPDEPVEFSLSAGGPERALAYLRDFAGVPSHFDPDD